jgi:hypothetical protein
MAEEKKSKEVIIPKLLPPAKQDMVQVTKQDRKRNFNPTGKGGFQDHPELINKKGRPPKGWAWSELLEDIGEEMVPGTDGKTFKQMVGRRLWVESAAGNIFAIKELFNRMEGMPRINMKVEGKVDTGSNEVGKLLQQMYAQLHVSSSNSNDKKDR